MLHKQKILKRPEKKGGVGGREGWFGLFQQILPVCLLMVTPQWFQYWKVSVVCNQGKEMERSSQRKQKTQRTAGEWVQCEKLCPSTLPTRLHTAVFIPYYCVWALAFSLLIQYYHYYILLLGKKCKQQHHLLSERAVNHWTDRGFWFILKKILLSQEFKQYFPRVKMW